MPVEPFLVRLARTYGWRAYAIPVLIVVTVWVFVDMFVDSSVRNSKAENSDFKPGAVAATQLSEQETKPGGRAHSVTTAPAAAKPVVTSSAWGPGPNPATVVPPGLKEGELPPGGHYTADGEGTYRLAGEPGERFGDANAKLFTYTVEVEEGLNPADFGGDGAFAAMVDATLSDPRGWTHDTRFAFQHIDGTKGKKPDLRIQLSSLNEVHKSCGTDIGMETSCFTSLGNRVVINESRWIRGALPFAGDLGAYRQYLISHEVGHGIGYAQHQPCGKDGALAPVMMQQTMSLSNSELHQITPSIYPDDQANCRFNSWPYPNLGPVPGVQQFLGPVPGQ